MNAPDHDLFDKSKPAPEAEGGIPLARAIGARNLMIIIVTMPLVFLFVVMGVIAVAGDPKRRAEGENVVATASEGRLDQPALYRGALEPLRASLPATGAPLTLPEGAKITAMDLDGDRLAVRIEGPKGGEIVIYDLASGATVQTIPVVDARGDL